MKKFMKSMKKFFKTMKKLAKEMSRDQILVVTISGRGDKDMQQIAEYRGVKIDD